MMGKIGKRKRRRAGLFWDWYKMETYFFEFRDRVRELFEQAPNQLKYFDYKELDFSSGEMRKVKSNHDVLTGILARLRNLGIVHWVGDLAETPARYTDLQWLVFNPEWVRPPVYKVVRSSGPEERKHGRIDWNRLRQLLPTRPEPINEGNLYQRLPFTDLDRGKIQMLMCACRLAFPIHNYSGLLIPDLLRKADPPRWGAEFHTEMLCRTLDFHFLPERVFLRFIADSFEQLDKQRPYCTRNELELHTNEECKKNVRALVHCDLSPVNGTDPMIQVAIHGSDETDHLGVLNMIIQRLKTSFVLEGFGKDPIKAVRRNVDAYLWLLDRTYAFDHEANWIHFGKDHEIVIRGIFEIGFSAVFKDIQIVLDSPDQETDAGVYSSKLCIGELSRGIVFRVFGHGERWLHRPPENENPAPAKKPRKKLSNKPNPRKDN